MIGLLRGALASKQAPRIVIDCHGVGYEVETPMSTFLNLPAIGADVELHTHLLVREDAQILYGFATAEERSLFRSLLRVSGVGAKIGLAILSTLNAADFRRCVEHEDAASLVKIPGIGRKTAERLIIEMRDKVAVLPGALRAGAASIAATPRGEAVDALLALGYRVNEVDRLIGNADLAGKSAEDIIRHALRQAAR
jgi:holliday junction DNA helicase RuvA